MQIYSIFALGYGSSTTLSNETLTLVPVEAMSTEKPVGMFPIPTSKQINLDNYVANLFP